MNESLIHEILKFFKKKKSYKNKNRKFKKIEVIKCKEWEKKEL